MFISNNIRSCVINRINDLSIEQHAEFAAVKISDQDIVIISFYRSPKGNVDIFLERLENALEFITLNHKNRVVLCGDFNIDVNVYNSKLNQFLNILEQFDFHYINNLPTRLNACLDNILTNYKDNEYTYEII